MKVSELIYQLQKYNPNADLYYVDRNNKKIKMFDIQTHDNDEGDKVSMYIKILTSINDKTVVNII